MEKKLNDCLKAKKDILEVIRDTIDRHHIDIDLLTYEQAQKVIADLTDEIDQDNHQWDDRDHLSQAIAESLLDPKTLSHGEWLHGLIYYYLACMHYRGYEWIEETTLVQALQDLLTANEEHPHTLWILYVIDRMIENGTVNMTTMIQGQEETIIYQLPPARQQQ